MKLCHFCKRPVITDPGPDSRRYGFHLMVQVIMGPNGTRSKGPGELAVHQVCPEMANDAAGGPEA